MSTLQQARRRTADLARRAARRGALSPLGRRLRPPTVSVIVPFYNVEKYVASCLDSILAQTFVDFEVILVDDGSPDGTRAIVEGYVARDRRLRIVTRENGGLGAARNTGIRHARGRYLTFVDSDDELTPDALAVLVANARRTGSQIVVGAVERFDSTTSWTPPWIDEVHTWHRDGVRLAEFLPLLRNLYTWNKLYERRFFLDQGLWFREGVAYEDQPIVTQLFVAADTIDVIPDLVYRYRMRDDRSSISQQTATLKDLQHRVLAWQVSQQALREVPEVIYRAWLQTLFNAHFNWYLVSAGTVDDDYWETIRAAVVELTEGAPDSVWAATPPENRVLLELTRQGRRADVQEFVRREAVKDLSLFRSRVTPDGLLLELPFLGDPDLPDELFLIRPEQLRLTHAVERLEWTAEALTLSGWAYLRKLDLAPGSGHTSHVDVVLTGLDSGREVVVAATDGVGAANPQPVSDEWCDYAPGTFAATVPTAAVLETGDSAWDASLRVTAAGFVVTTQITRLVRSGSPGALESGRLPDGRRLVPDWRYRHPLRLRVEDAGVDAGDLALDGRTLRGRLSGPAAAAVALVEVSGGGARRSGRVGADGSFEVPVPPARRLGDKAPVVWHVRGVRSEGARTAGGAVVDLQATDVPDLSATTDDSTLVPGRDRLGNLVVTEWRHGAEADAAEITPEGALRITGRAYGPGVRGITLATRSQKARSRGPAAPVSEGRFVVEHDLRHDAYRFGRLPLPYAENRVTALLERDGGEPVEVTLRISTALNRALPIIVDTPEQEGRVVRGPEGGVQVTLVRPLGEARSAYAGNMLRQRAASAERGTATRRGVLFRSYFGERATDNGVAIAEELARRGSDLPVYWAIQDHSVAVPAGGIPVVVNSPEWFDLLREVTYYVDNMYQPEYHRKPAGQVIVQTFHGYPFKQMGRPHWELQQFSQAKIDSYHQRSAEWDYLVSPATYATPLLTRDFGYDGEVLEIGYPRNDVLQSAQADSLREMTRRSLGIRDDQTVVLYAPTFRDYLAKDDNRALMSDFFDFDEVARSLGDDVVVLMRGHAFHARTRHRVGDVGTTIDVTDYPEVADLYLAADVGVVDYSSLRFDFGVTGKPMIFLVPDLQRYVETRGWLFDFEPTAPGPLVSTTAEVVEQLRDLDGLRARHRAAYETFQRTYLDLEDGHAAARFVDAVFVPRGDA